MKRGDILVASMIHSGMAPLMGLAAGLVVEMGGTLSHGAIIAREYGLPRHHQCPWSDAPPEGWRARRLGCDGGEVERLKQ